MSTDGVALMAGWDQDDAREDADAAPTRRCKAVPVPCQMSPMGGTPMSFGSLPTSDRLREQRGMTVFETTKAFSGF